MRRYLVRRAGQTLLTLFLVSIVIFLMIHLLPGNPAEALAGPNTTLADVKAISKSLGLSQPWPTQYWIWLRNIVVHGNLGSSYINKASVTSLIGARLPATLELAFAAMLIGITVGTLLGVIAALREGSAVDHAISAVGAVVLGMAEFWLGILLILGFAVKLQWLPPGGNAAISDGPGPFLEYITLPALTLASAPIMLVMRFVRTELIGVLRSDYILMARSKGLTVQRLLWRHALGNALVPLLTVFGLLFGRLISAAVIIEAVFSWPGLGRLLITSIDNRDYFVIQGVLLVFVAAFLVINFAVDVLYTVVDPRIRLDNAGQTR